MRRAARAFGPKEVLARARCAVAEAEIALASRDLNWSANALDAARATLEAHGDRVNAAHARYLVVRRLLLIGRLDEAEKTLAELDPAPLPPASRAAHELVVAGIAMRRLRTEAGARCAGPGGARRARGGYPRADGGGRKRVACPGHAGGAPDRAATSALSCLRMSKRCWRPRRWSWTPAGMPCVTRAPLSRWHGVRCCSRSRVRWAKRGPQTCRDARSSHAPSRRKARRRIASRAATSRDRAASRGAAAARRRHCDEGRLRAGAARCAGSRRAGTARRGAACGLARLSCRRRIVVELGPVACAWHESAQRAARARPACGGGQGSVFRAWARAPLDDAAGAGIRDDLVTPRSAPE